MSDPWRERRVIGDATLYLGDHLEILPTLTRFDLCLVDPPYGIGEAAGRAKTRTTGPTGFKNAQGASYLRDYGEEDWDDTPLSDVNLQAILRCAPKMIIWGGNYYALPPSSKWLIWDKENGATDFADCELAWTNLPGAVRIFRHMWNGMLRASERNLPRVHPTQKPIALMRWCLQQTGDVKSVIDPCMGSAPVGIACVERRIPYTGIESNARHFATACERIENAYRQGKLFDAPTEKPQQLTIEQN